MRIGVIGAMQIEIDNLKKSLEIVQQRKSAVFNLSRVILER